MLFRSLLVVLVIVVLTTAPATYSQDTDDTCRMLVEDALQAVGTACATMGTNEACYGHAMTAATFRPEAASALFAASGDIVALESLEALYTQPADPDTGEWGVALLQVHADLPSYLDESLMMVLYGDASVSSAVEEAADCPLRGNTGGNINVRGGPGTDHGIVGVFAADSSGTAYGRNAAGDWVRFTYGGGAGWMYAPLLALDCDPMSLPVVDDAAPLPTSPMQAIVLESHESSGCDNAPDGLYIRSPEGYQTNVIVNGVQLSFQSAGFITATRDDVMRVRGLDGRIDVTSFDTTVTVLPDRETTVPLDGLEAAGPPAPLFFNTSSTAIPDMPEEERLEGKAIIDGLAPLGAQTCAVWDRLANEQSSVGVNISGWAIVTLKVCVGWDFPEEAEAKRATVNIIAIDGQQLPLTTLPEETNPPDSPAPLYSICWQTPEIRLTPGEHTFFFSQSRPGGQFRSVTCTYTAVSGP